MNFKYNQFGFILFVWLYCICSNTFAEDSSPYLSCLDKPEMQALRSQELTELVNADQKERDDWDNLTEDEKLKMSENDLGRRKRVGEILGEGCFKTPEDYAAASLIYQHGNVPDHFFQAFVWASRAVALGDLNQKHLVTLTIDRYLISIGKKQLFGSQAYASEATGWCFCIEPVESSFPDAVRKEYAGASLQDKYDWLASKNEGKDCTNTECTNIALQPSPQGTVPGFW